MPRRAIWANTTSLTLPGAILPAQSGVRYRLHSIYLAARNTQGAPMTSNGIALDFTPKDRANANNIQVTCVINAAVVNHNHVEIADLDVEAQNGTEVKIVALGGMSPDIWSACLTYDEVLI